MQTTQTASKWRWPANSPKGTGEELRATAKKRSKGSRPIGTVLDPKGKAMAAIRNGGAYYSDADILGKPYVTGYEPIHDSSGAVMGIYYVGYPKAQ
ncbi:Cache 3/Cache 2 fusion domain-containing protein [Paraburkholderia strydomiana]|uniref:Cache 3/Cache 2 fusion domain-containing protein n=1 Tax=Paraburkholderia strydomiana TaxID=1245417 RepID=A0ABW9CD07_9BURK